MSLKLSNQFFTIFFIIFNSDCYAIGDSSVPLANHLAFYQQSTEEPQVFVSNHIVMALQEADISGFPKATDWDDNWFEEDDEADWNFLKQSKIDDFNALAYSNSNRGYYR